MMRFFWMTFLPLSAAGGAAALLLWLARPALRRFAHIQWSVPVLTAALCLFVLPLPVFAMPGAWNAPAQAVQSSVGTVLPAEAAASEPLFVMTELPTAADKLLRAAPQEHISMLWGLVPAFWLAGVLCAALALWAEYRRFTRHLAREARPVEDAAVRRCMAHAAKAGGFSRRVGLYACGALATPVAVGVLRPRIYLPADWAADETLEYALRHECMHLRRGHLVYKLAAQAVCVVHWFNPAAWLLRRMMSEACEFGCDRAVARRLDGAQRKEYCAAMLCAAADVRAAFSHSGGNLGTSGSVAFQFDRKGQIMVSKEVETGDKKNPVGPNGAAADEEEFMLAVAEAGGDDYEDADEEWIVYTAPGDLMAVVKELEAQGIQVKGAEMTMIANTPSAVSVADAKKVMRLIDKLEELEDLQAVYHTMDITDEIAEALDE